MKACAFGPRVNCPASRRKETDRNGASEDNDTGCPLSGPGGAKKDEMSSIITSNCSVVEPVES